MRIFPKRGWPLKPPPSVVFQWSWETNCYDRFPTWKSTHGRSMDFSHEIFKNKIQAKMMAETSIICSGFCSTWNLSLQIHPWKWTWKTIKPIIIKVWKMSSRFQPFIFRGFITPNKLSTPTKKTQRITPPQCLSKTTPGVQVEHLGEAKWSKMIRPLRNIKMEKIWKNNKTTTQQKQEQKKKQ